MAADDAAVIVTLRANLKDYEAALKNAVRATERAAKASEDAFVSVGKKGTAGKVIEGNFRKSSQAIANDARVLQFQLNDIFSGIASGQGIRAVQVQLGQIAQQMTGQSLVGGARLLGTALAGMVNPINLAVVAFGVLATVAASYFEDSEEGAKRAADALRKQADELDNLAKKYGALFPVLREAADQQRRIADETEKQVALEKARAAAYEASGKTVEGLNQPLTELMGSLDAMSKQVQAADLLAAWKALAQGIKDTNANSDDAKAVIDALNKIIAEQGGRVKALATAIRDELVAALDQLDTSAKKAGESLKGFSNVPGPGAGGWLTSPDRLKFSLLGGTPLDAALGRAADAIDGFVERVIQAESSGVANAKNPNSSATGAGQFLKDTWVEVFRRNFATQAAGMSDAAILELRTDVEANRRMIRAYATENAKLLIDAGQEVNEASLQLAHFLGAGGAIKVLSAPRGTPISSILSPAAIAANPSILGGGATREDVLAYAARRAGATVTPKLTAQEKAEQKAAREEALASQRQFIDQLQEQAQEMARLQQQIEGVLSSAITGFTNDLIAGKDAGEAFTNMLRSLTAQILEMAIKTMIVKPLVGGLFGQFGGGSPGLFEAGGTVGLSGRHDGRKFSPALWAGAPRFASGGMVGLRPGEVPIIAHRGEIVLPNARRIAGPTSQTKPSWNGSLNVNVDLAGANGDRAIAAAAEAAARKGARMALAQLQEQQRAYA